MATYKATGVDTNPVKAATGVQFTVAQGVYTTSSGEALADSDVLNMVKLPKGARVIDVILTSADIDSNGSPAVVLDVGDSADADRFIDGSTIGQAGGIERSNTSDPFFTFTADGYINVTVVTAPATQVNDASIKLTVLYTMDEIY